MDNLLLHIGWPKSGTSSIQGKLASNTDQLSRLGFLYPTVERAHNAHHPACGLLINHHDPLIPDAKGDLNDLIKHLNDHTNPDWHTAILSSEGFCRADSIKENVSELTARFNVTVVACFRDPLVWANSLMNQLVKMRLFFGHKIDLDALANEMILRDCRYTDRLKMWVDAFGRDKVKVVALEEGTDFSKAFFDAVGIDGSMLTEKPTQDGSNKSLGLGSLQFIQWIYKNHLSLGHSQQITINKRLHDCIVTEVPNLLSEEITHRIMSARSQIKNELMNNWLNGKPCFLHEPQLGVYGKSNELYGIDIKEIAERVLWDEPLLLEQLHNDVI